MLDHCKTMLAVLEFGSVAMLGWLAAAMAPWLIHRWNNRRPRETPWAAMDLLLSAVRRRASRARIQQWLLLAVRTAILTLVALAAAQPVWRPWALGAAAGVRTHHLILIDQSYSMSCIESAGSRFERAQMLARQTIESAPSGDLFTVIGWAQHAENVLGRPTFQASEAIAAVDEMDWTHATADLATALRAAEQAILRAKKQHPRVAYHRTIFFSDLARNTWQPDSESSVEVTGLCQQLSKEGELLVFSVVDEVARLWTGPFASNGPKTGDFGDAKHNNLAVTNISANPPLAMAHAPVTFTATIRTYGDRTWPMQEIVFSVDGVTVDRQLQKIATSDETAVRFEHRFVDPGQHSIRVLVEKASIEDAVDCLPLDNQRWMVLDVRDQVRVACIAGKLGAAKDLARALHPQPRAPRRMAPQLIQVETVPASRLDETDLSRFDAVFLCNVAELTDRDAVRLARYAQGGGALAFFLGDRVLPDRYQTLFDKLQIPVRIHAMAMVNEMRFDPLEYQHPMMEIFRGRENSGLLAARVSQYFPLEILPSDQPFETALRFRSGQVDSDTSGKRDPAIVVGSMGLGRVAVIAVPASLASRTPEGTPWTSLPINPSFLPLVREMLAHLVGDQEQSQSNVQVGQPLVGLANGALIGQNISVHTPDGQMIHQSTTAPAKTGTFAFAETSHCGIYSFHFGNNSGNELARFAVNLDTRESDLSMLLLSELPPGFLLYRSSQVNKPLAGLAYDTDVGDQALQSRLFTVALALLMAELLLAWWIGRGWG